MRAWCHYNLFQEWRQILPIISASILGLNSMALNGWPSPSIPLLLNLNTTQMMVSAAENVITMETASYLITIPALSSAITAPLIAYLMQTALLGRKYTLVWAGVPQTIAWLLIALSPLYYNYPLPVLFVSRVISGIAETVQFTVLPVYVSEVSTATVRSVWGNAIAVNMYLGLFLVNLIGGIFNMQITAYIFITLPLLYLLVLLRMPESPYHLAQQNHLDQAKKTLQYLRNTPNVDTELKTITEMTTNIASSKFSDCWATRASRRALAITLVLRWGQQFSGIAAFSLYAQYIFSSVSSSVSSTLASNIFTGTLVLCTLFSTSLLKFVGRKNCTVISTGGCSLTLFSISLFLYLEENLNILDLSIVSWYPIVGLILFIVFFSLGIGTIPFLLLGELFPYGIKGPSVCILTIFSQIYIAASAKLFQVLSAEVGFYMPFAVFGVCCLITMVYSIFWLPNTEGKTLNEIQIMLEND